MKRTIYTAFLFLFIFCSAGVFAQRDLYNWQLTPFAGASSFSENLEFPSDADSYTYGVQIDKRLGSAFTLGFRAGAMSYLVSDERFDINYGSVNFGFYWDNGFLFSKRSFISFFHKVELGFNENKGPMAMDDTSDDYLALVGLENGIKFRLSERFSAEFSFEMLLPRGFIDDFSPDRYNQYNNFKFGLNYHFGQRKSDFKAPIFLALPDVLPGDSRTDMTKMDTLQVKTLDTPVVEPKLDTIRSPEKPTSKAPAAMKISRADSLQIFMHFDSLYQRRDLRKQSRDSIAVKQKIEKIEKVEADTLSTEPLIEQKIKQTTRDVKDQSTDADSIDVSPALESKPSSSDTSSTKSSDAKKNADDTNRISVSSVTRNTEEQPDSTNTDTENSKSEKPASQDSSSAKSTASRNASVTEKDSTSVVRNPIKESGSSRDDPTSSNSTQNMPRKDAKTDSIANVERSVQSTTSSKQDSSIVKATTVVANKDKNEPSDNGNNNGQKSPDDSEKSDLQNERDRNSENDGQVNNEKVESANSNNEAIQSELERQNELMRRQNQLLDKSIDATNDLAKEERKSRRNGNVGALAGGAAIGAVAAGGGSNTTDTIYVQNEDSLLVDSLQQEIARLTASETPSDTLAEATKPTGFIYRNANVNNSNDSAQTTEIDEPKMALDSLSADTLSPDSSAKTQIAVVDSLLQDDRGLTPTTLPDTAAVELEAKPVEDPKPSPAPAALKASYPVNCNFGLNQSTLSQEQVDKLDLVAADLKAQPERSARLVGHTDSSGNAAYNLNLSKKRAEYVKSQLVERGVAESKISITGLGAEGSSEKFDGDSRRVEIVVE